MRTTTLLSTCLLALTACDFTVPVGTAPLDAGQDSGVPDAGGEPFDAGCTPKTCADFPSGCGDLSDGCGLTLACTCTGTQVCGAATPNVCDVPACANGAKDPGEADIDCGGSCARKCAAGARCGATTDCAAGHTCSETYCVPGVWATRAPVPTPRLAPVGVLGPQNRIWLVGGFTANGESTVVEVYDPQTDSWTTAPPMKRERYGHAGVIGKDGRLYVFGGQYDESVSPFTDGVSATAEVYDFTTQQWSDLPNLPDGRFGCSAAVLADGRIMVIGGTSVNPITTLARPDVFDPAGNGGAGSWAAAPTPLVTGRSSHASVQLSDGSVIVAGGWVGGGRTASAEQYDAAVGGWSTLPQMPFVNADAAAARGVNGRLYFFGGNAGSGDLAFTVVYDPATRQWSPAANMPQPGRDAAAVTTPDGRIWVMGGTETQGFSSRTTDRNRVLTP